MTTPEETEFQVARLEFFLAMEQSAEDHYALLALEQPEIDRELNLRYFAWRDQQARI